MYKANLNFLLSEIPIFRELSSEESAVISQYLFPKELAQGDLVCKEGQHGNFLCFVAHGELEVTKSVEGKDVVISTITEGGSLGEMALIDGLTRSATVKASVPTSVLVLRRNDFQTILDKYPSIGVKVLKGIARLLSLNLRRTSSEFSRHMLTLA